MERIMNANPAFVPTASSRRSVSTKGFNRGELENLIANVDAAEKACPCRRGAYRYEECPKCGATSSHPCGPVVSAEGKVVSAVRQMLNGDKQ